MLFKTIKEIQEFLPVASTFQFHEIARFILEAEWEHLVHMLGERQYSILEKRYQEDDLKPLDAELLQRCRMALAPFAYAGYIPWGQVQINSSGIQIASNENYKTAFQWQIEDLEGSAVRSGHAAMERLLLFLQENARQFPYWLTSNAYKEIHSHFLISATQFSTFAGRSFDRYAFMQMLHLREGAERRTRKLLGKKFYDELIRQLLVDNLSPKNLEVVEMVRSANAQFMVAKAITSLSLKIGPNGITVQEGKNTGSRVNRKAAPDKALQALQDEASQATEEGFKEIKSFLDENHTDYNLYPYQEPGDGDGQINGGSGVYGLM